MASNAHRSNGSPSPSPSPSPSSAKAVSIQRYLPSLNGSNASPSIPSFDTLKQKRPIRVYIDGCFDVMHFGHANALRQAKALGDELLVGVCSSAEMAIHKGPSVMDDDERVGVVASMKWVDQVLLDAPYVLTDDFLRTLIEQHHIDLIVHGDDPCLGADGTDAYATAKRAGRFRTIKRTEGVSSTDVVQRLLLRSGSSSPTRHASEGDDREDTCFLMTSRRLVQFAGVTKPLRSDDHVVYVHGDFDLFHAGHVNLLKRAKQLGNFLLVGIVGDLPDAAHEQYVMNVHERSLMVLACRHVDDVIIGAPARITHDLVMSMNVSKVVQCVPTSLGHVDDDDEMFKVARDRGILHQLKHDTLGLNVDKIVQRVGQQQHVFIKRNERKLVANAEYTTKLKTFVEEG